MTYIIEPAANFSQLRVLDKYLAGTKGFVAGGVFKNIFNNEQFRDVDIWFNSEADLHHAVGVYTARADEPKAITETENSYVYDVAGQHVELIKVMHGMAVEILGRFDFTVTKFAYGDLDFSGDRSVTYHDKFFEHLLLKRLVIDDDTDLTFPFNTWERSYKYARYGFGLCTESKERLIESLRTADFDPAQLTNTLYRGLD